MRIAIQLPPALQITILQLEICVVQCERSFKKRGVILVSALTRGEILLALVNKTPISSKSLAKPSFTDVINGRELFRKTLWNPAFVELSAEKKVRILNSLLAEDRGLSCWFDEQVEKHGNLGLLLIAGCPS